MKKIEKIFIITLIIFITSTCLNSNLAVTSGELQNKKNDVKNSISTAEEELKDIKEEKSEALKEVEKVMNEIDKYESEIDILENQIKENENKISESEKEIEKSQKDIEEKQDLLEKRLVAMYESGNTSYIELLLSSADLTDFISKYYLISELATYDTELIGAIRERKESLEKSKVELESTKAELDKSKNEKQEKMKSLSDSKSEKESKVKVLSKKETEAVKQIDELKSYENSINNQIIKLQKEYDEQQKKNNSSNNSNSNNKVSSYGFGYPTQSAIITTKYGSSGSYWSSGKHTGIDFKASVGTPVFSVGNGKVVDTGFSKSYGNFVEIYHGNNVYSFYAHGSSLQVKVGQDVAKGQQIMLSGATGNVTGPHLHFEIRTPGPKYANCVNPMPYLP